MSESESGSGTKSLIKVLKVGVSPDLILLLSTTQPCMLKVIRIRTHNCTRRNPHWHRRHMSISPLSWVTPDLENMHSTATDRLRHYGYIHSSIQPAIKFALLTTHAVCWCISAAVHNTAEQYSNAGRTNQRISALNIFPLTSTRWRRDVSILHIIFRRNYFNYLFMWTFFIFMG